MGAQKSGTTVRSAADLTLKWKGREGGVGEPQSASQRLFKVVWESSNQHIGPSLPHKRHCPRTPAVLRHWFTEPMGKRGFGATVAVAFRAGN